MKEEELKLGPWNDSSIVWVCENHPTKEQSHKVGLFRKECGGAGMPYKEVASSKWKVDI